MKEQKKHTGEAAELEQDKAELLQEKALFTSYGFYMPDFEKTVREMTALEFGRAFKFLSILKGRGAGESLIKDAARKEIEGYKGHIIERLSFSPDPGQILAYELAQIEKGKFIPLPGGLQKQADATPHFNWPKVAETGYHDAVFGRSGKSLKDYFADAVATLPPTDYQTTLFNENDICYINPQILKHPDISRAAKELWNTVNGYANAFKEAFLKKVETRLNAGKEIREILRELFPETESEGSLKEPETAAPEMSLQPAEPEPFTETQKPGLKVLEIALLHFYQREPMTRETAAKIAKECGETAGRDYSTGYVYRLMRECADVETRQQRGKGKTAKENRRQILEGLREHLPQNLVLDDDIRAITAAKKRPKK